MNRSAEQFILALRDDIEGPIVLTYDSPGGPLRPPPPKFQRNPGESNRLARRTAAAKNRLRARDADRPILTANV
jgi:hypothetical protein